MDVYRGEKEEESSCLCLLCLDELELEDRLTMTMTMMVRRERARLNLFEILFDHDAARSTSTCLPRDETSSTSRDITSTMGERATRTDR